MKILAVIGARCGSKGIPGKNIIELCGKPLLAWSIDAAKKSDVIDKLIVSTDDRNIAGIARRYGAEIPFMRPAKLASEKSSQVDMVNHALQWLWKNQNYKPNYILLLQPTSPLRTGEDISNAVELAKKQDCDAVISVCKVKNHPFVARTIDPDGTIKNMWTDRPRRLQRQELPDVYSENGAIYLVKLEAFMREQDFMPKKSVAYIMPAERSVDIDEPLDLKFAEVLLKENPLLY